MVRPKTGESFWLILSTVNKQLSSMALLEFAEWVGAGRDERGVSAIDRAGWHASEAVALPDMLPAYPPELQPAERLWPLVDEPVANRRFAGLDDSLEGVLAERCREILRKPETVRSHAYFHRWREAAS